MRLVKGKTFYDKPIYQSWRSMMDRCTRERAGNFKYYGGRGVKVCDEWQNIELFEIWALEHGYEPGLTLDRIDNNGNYCPQNCRWATKKEQANNRRNNVRIEMDGQIHTLAEWAEILGINKNTLKNRYWRGLETERVLEGRNLCSQ